jgi:hypothetical protein
VEEINMVDELNGLLKTGANTIEGVNGLAPSRFVYKGREYELYDKYNIKSKASKIMMELKARKMGVKMVKLHGYIRETDVVYAVYATDLKYPAHLKYPYKNALRR